MGAPVEYQRAMRGDFTEVEADAERVGEPWATTLRALLANTVDTVMPAPLGSGVAQSLAHRQRVLRAALTWDRSGLEAHARLTTSLPLVDVLARRWLAVFDGHALQDIDAGLVREGGQIDPSLVIELRSVDALAALNRGAAEEALSIARRASRMAASESLLQGEYLANIVLARARRHGGMGHYAIRVLSALDAVVPPVWKPWIDLELGLAGARSLTVDAPIAYRLLDRERQTARALVSSHSSPDAFAWVRGEVADVPFGLRAPSHDPLCLAVVVVSETGARRMLRAGLPRGCPLIPPSPKARRLHEALCIVLLEPEGIAEAKLFEQVYGYAPEDLGHDGVLRGLLHRMRKSLAGMAELERSQGRVRVVPQLRFAVPDPRCETLLDDRILTYLAAQRGRVTAKDIGSALQIPLRTVQRKLGKLVEDGACIAESDRQRTAYVVEDTTFFEPTLHRLRGRR